MNTPYLDKLAADIEADPKAKAHWAAMARKMRPTILEIQAHWESMFPPESPTSKRRGGNKMAPSPEFIFAVAAFLDAKMGNEYKTAENNFTAAMKSADADYFRMMAEAAQYVRDMPQAHSLFARHTIAARRIAARMMGKDGPLPSWGKVREQVAADMGQAAYDETSKEWGRVKRAAQLCDLPR